MIEQVKQIRFTYPVTLTPDESDGGFVMTFPDMPEAITQGDTIKQCLSDAVDCLDESIAARIDDGEPIPPAVGSEEWLQGFLPNPYGDQGCALSGGERCRYQQA